MDGEAQEAEDVGRMRAGIKRALLRAGTRVKRLSPYGLIALLAAGAFAPVLVPAAGVVAGASAVAAIGLLGNVGANILTNLLSEVIDQLRERESGREPGQEEVEQELVTRIEAILTANDDRAESLRAELAGVLREIGTSQVALETAVRSGNQELQFVVTDGLAKLSTDFAEFGFLLTDLRSALWVIQETMRTQHDQQAEQLNSIIEQLEIIERRTRYVRTAGAAAEYEEYYRRSVREALDRIELFGLNLPRVPRSYRLGAAYVSLLLERTGIAANSGNSLRLEDLLGNNRRILVEGAAGTGKSTVLRYLALRVLDGNLAGFDRENSSLIPFLLKLRSFAKDKTITLPDNPEKFLRAVIPIPGKSKPRNWVGDLLSDGRGLVLIDGLDEIRESHRASAINWLKQLINSYPDSCYVLTSRPAALREVERDELRARKFATARIEPMTEIQVSDFIDRWYGAALETASASFYMNASELGLLAMRLKMDLRRRPDLRALANTPLLCAVICAVNMNGRYLPERRTELYRTALDLLLARRDVARDIRGAAQLPIRQSQFMLGRIAQWMLINDQDFISRRDALAVIADSANAPEEFSKYMLQQLLEQTGLLQETDADSIEFRYSSFREYLAAIENVRQNSVNYLLSNSGNPAYREVIADAIELADLPVKQQLLAGLVTRAEHAEGEGKDARQLWLLAADGLREAGLPDALAARVRDGLRGEGRRAGPG